MARVSVNKNSWTQIATTPAHVRYQVLTTEHVMIAAAATAPTSEVDGEIMPYLAIEHRTDLAVLGYNLYARSINGAGLLNVET